MSYRIAIDIGGTFTDYVALDEETGSIIIEKSTSTPSNFADGVTECIDKASIPLEKVSYIVHGSTIVINALIERKGANTALITTKGFKDILEIGRANRTDLYNYYYTKPKPFIPRKYRFEIGERVNKDGEVIIALNIEQVEEVIKKLKEEKIEAVAVCFLHSYANSKHEKIVKEIIKKSLPNIAISISSELIKEWREYERTNTTVFNAFIKPLTNEYLNTLKRRMNKKGLRVEPYAMQSNGGTATFEMAKINPIHLVESGPVGGVIGANEIGKIIGEKNIITLDIGGTTAKTSLIYNNEVKITTDYHLEKTPIYAGYPIKVAIADIIEIGAGGGSIAWINSVDNLKVGPHSAGADPGPACYNRGGLEPTLTDANYIAGRIDLKRFLKGKYDINIEKSYQSIKKIADFYKISIEEAARAIIRITNNNMMNALKLVSVRKGYDPREFVMIAMGGNGGVHSTSLGRELKVKKIIIPNNPGVFSAWGMLMTDLRQDYIRTKVVKINNRNVDIINEIYDEMIEHATKTYISQGFLREKLYIVKSADIRYFGQEHTVRTPIYLKKIRKEDLEVIREKFGRLHKNYYSFNFPDAETEFVNFNITAFCKIKRAKIEPIKIKSKPEEAIRCKRIVDFDEDGISEVPVYLREKLGTNNKIKGPAIIEENTSATVLYPNQELYVDDYGNLIIQEA